MVRSREMTLSLPPFTPAVIWLLGLNTAVFLLMELFGLVLPGIDRSIFDYFSLIPSDVTHGWIWQIVTYSFLHAGFWHWFGNMLGLWMFGSALEGAWGSRRFVELFSFGVIGAAITTIVVSYGHVLGGPNSPTVGASGGVFAILIAFGIVFAENEIMLIPFPFLIKAKYFIAILIVVSVIPPRSMQTSSFRCPMALRGAAGRSGRCLSCSSRERFRHSAAPALERAD